MRCNEGLVFIAHSVLRGIKDGFQDHVELYLIDRLGFGAIGRLKDRVSDCTSDFLLDGVDDTFLDAANCAMF